MTKETMTPRERWQAVLTRQPPDRVPMDYWSTPEFSIACTISQRPTSLSNFSAGNEDIAVLSHS